VLLFAAIVAFFIYGLIASMLGTILHDLSLQFVLSPRQNGWIAGSQAVGLILSSLVAGPLIDYAGLKTGMVIGLALITCALFLLPLVRRFETLLVLLFILGAGGATVVASASALSGHIDEAHRGSVLNLTNLFFGVGGMLTPFLAANVLSHNWKRLCRIVAGLSTITLVIEASTRMPTLPGGRISGTSMLEVLKSPLLWMASIFLFLYTACEVGIWNWLPGLLISRGISKSRALNALSLGFALGLLIGRAVVSLILLRVLATHVAIVAAVGIAFTTFWLLQTRSHFWSITSVFCAGLFMAPIFPTTMAVVGDHFSHLSGTAMGLAITGGWIGLAISSPIIGAIAGDRPDRLGRALLLIPIFSTLMIAIGIAMRFRA